MGNVQANAKPDPSVVVMPSSAKAETEPVAQMPVTTKPDNPGTMEDIYRKTLEIYPSTFEGAKVLFQKQMDPDHCMITHNLNLATGADQKSGYKFSANYVGTPVSMTELDHMVMCDADLNGCFTINAQKNFADIKTKFMGSIDAWSPQVAQLTTDWKGEKASAALTLGNINPWTSSGTTVLHYLQRLNKNVSVGAELISQFTPQAPGGKVAVPSIAVRYEGTDFTTAATLGSLGFRAMHHQKCSETVQVVSEFDANLRLGEAVGSIGYQIDIPKSHYTFKGKVDSNWTVAAGIEKQLQPLGISIIGSMNHSFRDGKTGIGFGLMINVAADQPDPSEQPPQ